MINHGGRNISGMSTDFKPTNMIMKVADVKKTLASAYQIVQGGNKILLDSKCSYILNKAADEKTNIEVSDGEFQFDLWVPAPIGDQLPIKVQPDGR